MSDDALTTGENGSSLGANDGSDPSFELGVRVDRRSRFRLGVDVLGEGGLRCNLAQKLGRFREQEEIQRRLEVRGIDQRRRERLSRFDVLEQAVDRQLTKSKKKFGVRDDEEASSRRNHD